MLKKVLIGLGVLLGLLAVAGFVFRDWIGFALFAMALQPDVSFEQDRRHTPPDYADPVAWAALPDQEDYADISPTGLNLDVQPDAPVDVFFIHPTTYYKSDHWNQPLPDEETDTFTDEQVLKNQASTFNSCCNIYAPRYRQATLFAFMDDGEDGPAALKLAYSDVAAAFDHFIEHYNQGRPFILAGHSQGAKHADTLLAEVIAGTQLERRMVAAYPVGFSLDGSNGIPVCESATQTGCQVTWNSVAPDAPAFQDTSSDICVNPLNWRTDDSHADFSENLGAVSHTEAGDVEPGTTDAQCSGGRLLVSEVRSDNYSGQMFGPGNYHIYDFNFFHMNIRRNAEQRVAAFLAGSAGM